jgi:hypothetical protein
MAVPAHDADRARSGCGVASAPPIHPA